MFHRIIPIYNGTFSVSFEGAGEIHLPRVENIPSFVFLVIDKNDEPVLVDTGFRMDWIAGHNSTGVKNPGEDLADALGQRGYPPDRIKKVIQTHLHWDHAAGMDLFPSAEFYIQAAELRGLLSLNPNEETYFIPGHWLHLLPRIRLVNGTYTLKPGVTLHYTGGHSPGHQVVAVETAGGRIILGGDAPFNYDTLWKTIPPDYWERYRKGPGSRFYWDDQVIPAITDFLRNSGLLETPDPPHVEFHNLQAMGKCLYSHDPRLLKNGIIG